MKKIIPLIFTSFLLLSCSNVHEYELKDYQTVFEYKNGYKVLVLSDIHLATTTNLDKQFNYLTKVIYSNYLIDYPNANIEVDIKDESKRSLLASYAPDLIMLNGDTYMIANRNVVDESLAFIDSFGIPFGFINGNHDLQGLYGNRYVDNVLKSKENSIYKNPRNDNVTGDTNYVVNLKDGDEVKWQVFAIDCNTYYLGKYDSIQDNQVDWYKKQVVDGGYANSIIISHIPLQEYEDAWRRETNGTFAISSSVDYTGKSSWYLGDKAVAASPYGDNLFEAIQEMGGVTKGFIAAHDHMNISDFVYRGDYDHDVRLIYGLKGGDGIYHDDRFMGGSFYTLNDDGTFEIAHNFVPYGHSETNGVFKMSKTYIESGGSVNE